jgi:hypothetical protein
MTPEKRDELMAIAVPLAILIALLLLRSCNASDC